jgi:hypothetical protein
MTWNAPSPNGQGNDLLTRVVVTLWGVQGNNGVVGTQKLHGKRLEDLERLKRDIELVFRALRWLGLGVTALIGFMLSDTVSTVLAGLVR